MEAGSAVPENCTLPVEVMPSTLLIPVSGDKAEITGGAGAVVSTMTGNCTDVALRKER